MIVIKKSNNHLASLWERTIAANIDLTVLVIVFYIGRVIGLENTWLYAYCFVIFVLYDSVFSILSTNAKKPSGSLGKFLGNLHIVNSEYGRLDPITLLLRSFLKAILSPLIFVSYLTITFRMDNKALHDLILNTAVIKLD